MQSTSNNILYFHLFFKCFLCFSIHFPFSFLPVFFCFLLSLSIHLANSPFFLFLFRTNISCIRGKYHLYEVTSVWNKEKGRAQKKTGKYLGRITEEGLIHPKRESISHNNKISVNKYGASHILKALGEDIYKKLCDSLPKEADTIFTLAILRMIEKCSYKRASLLYKKSFLSETFGEIPLSGARISSFLRSLGQEREKIIEFTKEFTSGTEYTICGDTISFALICSIFKF